jgi:hypothetical protein
MNEVLTTAEINERFPSEWVLLVDPQTDENLEVLGGKVIYHGKDRDEVDRKAMEVPIPRHIAVFYTGPFPEEMEFILSARRSTRRVVWSSFPRRWKGFPRLCRFVWLWTRERREL